MRQSAGIPFGHFVLKKRLARGGMAEVFLAAQRGPQGFDRRVAVKRVLPHLVESDEFVRMFHDEARLAARLTHPNIVHIYEFGRVDEHYFIAMEYVEGVHAGSLIKQGKREKMPPALVARIGADACAGLHYAHGQRDDAGRPLKIVHRDISPPNLMITYDGVVKLVDFGIAKAVSQVEQTRPGVVKGKYAYMSPEQTTNKPLDGRSDVFSLGMVLWEVLAGRVALSRSDPVEAMRAIRDGRLPRIEDARPDVPAGLAAAITAALEVDRDDRPTASELGLMLEGFIKSSPELGTSMELAEWIGSRFPRAAPTGEQQALRTPPGRGAGTVATSAGTAAGTVATTAGTVATGAGTVATTPGTMATSHLPTAATTEVDIEVPGDDQMTAIVPQRSLEPPLPLSSYTAHSGPLPAATGRGRRIAIAAGATALVGGVLLAVLLAGNDAGGEPAPEPLPVATTGPADAAPDAEPPPIIDAAPPDAAIDAAPELSALEVITDPAGALVTVGDDRPAMTSPAMFRDLPAGSLTVQIELDGFRPIERTVTLDPGEHRTLDYALDEIAPPITKRRNTRKRPSRRTGNGKLTARTNPYSVVYLGSKKLGVTPFANISLPAGTHTLTFKNPGRKPYKKRVTIRSGKTTKLNFELP